MRARLLGMLGVAVWAVIETGLPDALFYLGGIAALAASGVFPLWLARRGYGAGWLYLQPILEIGFFAAMVMVANPLSDDTFGAPMRLRYRNDLYLFLFVAAYGLSYSPRFVLWSGFAAAAMWSLGVLGIALQPGVASDLSIPGFEAMSADERLASFLDPDRILLGLWLREAIVLIAVGVIGAIGVSRARRLVYRQVDAERQRANLSRYFSPNLVEELATSEGARATRKQDVAVLFADLEGFTTMAAEREPDEVIGLLRDYHGRLSREVFAHGGTLDEYLGDGVMATFGTPVPGEADASAAIRCALGIAERIDEWNRERAERGEPALIVRVGVHHGSVVLGNVGDEQLKFAVVGDTVNAASRLQELSRELPGKLALSEAVVAAARAEEAADQSWLDRLPRVGSFELRGRTGSVVVYGRPVH